MDKKRIKGLVVVICLFIFQNGAFSQETSGEEILSSSPLEVPSGEISSPPPSGSQPSRQSQLSQESRRGNLSSGITEERLLQAIQANPTDRNAYNRLLDYYRAQQRTQDHLKVLIKAIQNVGGNLTYYLWMGDDYVILNDYSKALISYQYALKESPTNAVVYLKLGNVHVQLKNYYKAETALLAALYYGEKSGKINVPYVYRLLGECYEGVKNYSEALKWYQKAYKLSPIAEYKVFIDRIQMKLSNQ